VNKLFTLILTALLCACSAEVADVSEEPVVAATEEIGTNVCDPFITEPYVPAANWVAFNIFNTGLVSCTATNDVRFSVTWCEIWTSGTSGCGNRASHVGPYLLSAYGQAGYNQNIWVSGVTCAGPTPTSSPNFLGQRVQATVEWKKSGKQYRRTATHDCL
jgi:hypothetical protein